MQLRSQTYTELHKKEVEKRGWRIQIAEKKHPLDALDIFKNEIIEELKKEQNKKTFMSGLQDAVNTWPKYIHIRHKI